MVVKSQALGQILHGSRSVLLLPSSVTSGKLLNFSELSLLIETVPTS